TLSPEKELLRVNSASGKEVLASVVIIAGSTFYTHLDVYKRQKNYYVLILLPVKKCSHQLLSLIHI
ncbi:hypothetical protein, partial [Candidatus Enterococcus wittei]|uniref:hypothetical protein n=1 Tax=Candidatus Enterococcus wittei TaxID=1987383 RepID=UPI001C4F578A